MKNNLCSKKWAQALEKMRQCHVSQINGHALGENAWYEAFYEVVDAIKEERQSYPDFAVEITKLTEETGFDYDFKDIFEEYFDHLEAKEAYSFVIESAKEIICLFRFKEVMPSEYMYRIGNAYMRMGMLDHAYTFGQDWLKKYPQDYYAAASNVFLLIEMDRISEAEAITKKYMEESLICEDAKDTFYMAAYRLYEITKDSYAKGRVLEKMNEFTQKNLK